MNDSAAHDELVAIRWVDGAVELIDQTRLPDELVTLRVTTLDPLVDAVARLAVRGAPALGVVGAYGVRLVVEAAHRDRWPGERLDAALATLRTARPTAANLAWAVDRVAARIPDGPAAVAAEATAVADENAAAMLALSRRGADLADSLIDGPVVALTHCNTGALACVSRGTALGVLIELHHRGRLVEVIASETRPLLQGARLTTWELGRLGIDHHLAVDGAGPALLAAGRANLVVVGADRIAANGDVANKIGTYAHAVAAARAGVPVLVAAPESTIDTATPTGADIEIEDRAAGEVVSWRGVAIAPPSTPVLNPAFDITPSELVAAIVTETRVIRPARGERP